MEKWVVQIVLYKIKWSYSYIVVRWWRGYNETLYQKLAHSSTCPRLLVCFREGEKLYVFSLSPQNQNRNKSCSYSSSQPIENYHMTYSKHGCPITIKTESVHGLICFHNLTTLLVWNTSMRKFLELLKIGKKWNNATVFLGIRSKQRYTQSSVHALW